MCEKRARMMVCVLSYIHCMYEFAADKPEEEDRTDTQGCYDE